MGGYYTQLWGTTRTGTQVFWQPIQGSFHCAHQLSQLDVKLRVHMVWQCNAMWKCLDFSVFKWGWSSCFKYNIEHMLYNPNTRIPNPHEGSLIKKLHSEAKPGGKASLATLFPLHQRHLQEKEEAGSGQLLMLGACSNLTWLVSQD